MSPRPSPSRPASKRDSNSPSPSGTRRSASPGPNTSSASPRFSPYNIPSSPATSLRDLPPHEIKRLNQFLRHHTIRMAAEYLASYRLKLAIEQGVLPRPTQKAKPAARASLFSMDLIDDPDSPTVMAVFEVPGCSASDLIVRIQDSKLFIHGERKPLFPLQPSKSITNTPPSMSTENPPGDHRPIIQHREVRFGTFFRDINVPSGTRQSDITARLENGMLTVTWPRHPQQTSHPATITELPPMIAPSA